MTWERLAWAVVTAASILAGGAGQWSAQGSQNDMTACLQTIERIATEYEAHDREHHP